MHMYTLTDADTHTDAHMHLSTLELKKQKCQMRTVFQEDLNELTEKA